MQAACWAGETVDITDFAKYYSKHEQCWWQVHDNARCEACGRMKSELLYDRYNTETMTTEELKVLIWRYFISYWNNRRICSANGGFLR